MSKEEQEEVTIITTKNRMQTYIRQNYVSKKLIQDKIEKINEEIKQMEENDIGNGGTLGTAYIEKLAEVKTLLELLD